MPSISLIGISLIALALVYKNIIVPAFLSPLSKIPNAHFTSPVLPTWIWWKRRNATAKEILYSLHHKYGPVVRLGPNELSVNSAGGLRTIYMGGFQKDDWYRDAFINYQTPNMVSMLEHKPHSTQKRMLSHVYSKSYLQTCPDLQVVAKKLLSERLFPHIESLSQSGTPLNVFPYLQGFGMDFTSAYLFGSANGTDFLTDDKYCDHWLSLYTKFKTQLPAERKFGEIEQWCLALCDGAATCIEGLEKSGTEGSTAPIVYGQLSDCLKKEGLSGAELRLRLASEMLDHLIAGHETSGITMTYLMYELSKQPLLQARLREELRTLSPPISHPPTSESLASPKSIDALPLLDAALRETLRLYAAAPAPQPRITPFSSKPVDIEGYGNIPGGVKVASSAYVLHRNENVYPAPEQWIPERWMSSDPNEITQMRRWFWPFGSGGRMCLGSNFAMQNMKLAIAAIYSNFTTEIVDDEGIEQDDSFIAAPASQKLMLRFKRA
ncbi:hypothetical protein AJ80_05591 [Polytolypa hystricis UAMH7299]|uniref:Cytochrome P450 monooxygenase n=1 Tax=Polytolypa hystricis (strain UAMH7299) TaxID=1447883 RepID=A0A2B7Y327_POLH7|nr:hypothetical protein AJ80_05591 [Polytolypa hystricis UAMH7299]